MDDYTRDWVHPRNSFDFVHARALYATVEDWPKFYQEAYNTLKPGGWFEHLETTIQLVSDDGTIPNPSRVHEWTYWLDVAGSAAGKSWKISEKLKGWMIEGGFQNVTEVVYKLPVGNWPKDEKYKAIGQFNLLNVLEGSGMCCLDPTMFGSFLLTLFINNRRMDIRSIHTSIKGIICSLGICGMLT